MPSAHCDDDTAPAAERPWWHDLPVMITPSKQQDSEITPATPAAAANNTKTPTSGEERALPIMPAKQQGGKLITATPAAANDSETPTSRKKRVLPWSIKPSNNGEITTATPATAESSTTADNLTTPTSGKKRHLSGWNKVLPLWNGDPNLPLPRGYSSKVTFSDDEEMSMPAPKKAKPAPKPRVKTVQKQLDALTEQLASVQEDLKASKEALKALQAEVGIVKHSLSIYRTTQIGVEQPDFGVEHAFAPLQTLSTTKGGVVGKVGPGSSSTGGLITAAKGLVAWDGEEMTEGDEI